MGVHLLLKPLDKANSAYEVGEVGVRAPKVFVYGVFFASTIFFELFHLQFA